MIRICSFMLMFSLSAAMAFAEINTNKLGLALKGYDPVAYINDGKAVLGNAKYYYQWNGATWYFSSSLYRDVFVKMPDLYIPQYGGYCAFSMAQGNKMEIDPKAFAVINGKLYFVFSAAFLKIWLQNINTYIPQADAAWKKLNE